jgi:aminocarboxymuconate-semialdehyde decarboxylase
VRIDVHAHYLQPDFSEGMARRGAAWQSANRDAGISLEQRFDLMAEAGIDVQVLSVSAHQPYVSSAFKAVDAATFANDFYQDLVERSNGRFLAFGCLPLPHVDPAVEEAARCLDDLGMRGITLGCSVLGRPLDDPSFEPLWAELDRRAAVVFLHPIGTGAPMAEAYGLTWMVAGCYEDTTAALRLVLSGLTTRYPNVKIIIPHLGGTIPFLWQRLVDSLDRNPTSQVDPVVALRRLYYDTVNETPAALRCTCETVGARQVLLGTDYPYLLGEKFKRCVTYVQESGLPPSDVEAILERNAETLLSLTAPAPGR